MFQQMSKHEEKFSVVVYCFFFLEILSRPFSPQTPVHTPPFCMQPLRGLVHTAFFACDRFAALFTPTFRM
jgi:hypothetical protein